MWRKTPVLGKDQNHSLDRLMFFILKWEEMLVRCSISRFIYNLITLRVVLHSVKSRLHRKPDVVLSSQWLRVMSPADGSIWGVPTVMVALWYPFLDSFGIFPQVLRTVAGSKSFWAISKHKAVHCGPALGRLAQQVWQLRFWLPAYPG